MQIDRGGEDLNKKEQSALTKEIDMTMNWLLCPTCHNKTRIRLRQDTMLLNFLLYCPKCRNETLINVEQMNISIIREPDAKTQSR